MILIHSVEVNDLTLHAKLKACCSEELGYKTLIFEDLEFKDPDFKYISCVLFPHWNQAPMRVGDEGFLQIKYISAGKDMWFDGKDFVPYKYTNIQFLKFTKTFGTSTGLILD